MDYIIFEKLYDDTRQTVNRMVNALFVYNSLQRQKVQCFNKV